LALAVLGGRAYLSGDDDGLRVKGQTKVWIYWERDGQVAPWAEGTPLMNGDRIRIEVQAAEGLVAYHGVISENGRLLSEPQSILDNPLRLAPGAKASFEGSIKLVGANEGETLLVLLCRQALEAEKAAALFPAAGADVNLPALPADCATERFKLR
jgi:hypothetical protein